MRSLRESFNDLSPVKASDSALRVSNGYGYFFYDFAQRFMTSYVSNSGATVTPFSELDREVVVEMREKLIELGGKPPELPPEAPAATSPAKKLNL